MYKNEIKRIAFFHKVTNQHMSKLWQQEQWQ